LDTAENKAFNERLWAEATAERQRETEELGRLQKLRQEEQEGAAPVSQGVAGKAHRTQLALDESERATTPTWLHSVRSSALRGWVVLALGLAVSGFLLAAFHRSPLAGLVVLAALAAVLLAASRRAP